MSVVDFLKQSEEVVYEDDSEPQFPRGYHHNEQGRAGKGGWFFIEEDELIDPPGPPWKPETVHFQSGGTAVGYVTRYVRFAYIGYRKYWFRINAQGGLELFPTYHDDTRSKIEALGFVEGINKPMCLIFKGKASEAFEGIVRAYKNGLLRDAARVVGKKKLDPWSFWLPIGPKVDGQGKVVYQPTGHGGSVTPPALHLPSGSTEKLVESLFVGEDLYALGKTLRVEYADWLSEWNPKRATTAVASREAQPDVSSSTSIQEIARTNKQTADPDDLQF